MGIVLVTCVVLIGTRVICAGELLLVCERTLKTQGQGRRLLGERKLEQRQPVDFGDIYMTLQRVNELSVCT